MRFCFLLVTGYWLLVTLPGCGPTYPKERFEESIVKLCKKEYSLDVKVETTGKTIAIYLPLTDLLDFNFTITKGAHDKINDVITSVTRVVLSTDAKVNFYCLIAHDIRIPEIQLVLVKYVDDVKRYLLGDISRGEYSKRMLIDMRLNPQAQKERSIKEVFDKMNLDIKWREEVMNTFFRSEPSVLGEIGYWSNRFYIKDITVPEFLAEQIASRITTEFREEANLKEGYLIKSSKGAYISKEGKRILRFDILAEPRWVKGYEKTDAADRVFEAASQVASEVIHGYRFDDFDYSEIVNQSNGRVLAVSRDDLELFRKRKIDLKELGAKG